MSGTELRLGERFGGPPGSANGGYTCGAIAELLGGGVEVTLRRPPPLGRPLRLRRRDGGAVVHDGDQLVAEARPATVALDVPGVVSPAQAERAARGYPLFRDHPFPTCFTCGPERAAGDGLRIFPGPVPGGGDLWAAPWTPDPSVAGPDGLVAPEVVWAALDCPGGLAVMGGAVVVLGRMAARMLARPRAGTPYCLLAWPDGAPDGRKRPAGSALLDGQGAVLAVARAVWMTLA